MTSTPSGIDVGGRVITVHQLEGELEATGIPVPGGLSILGPDQAPGVRGDPPDPHLPPGSRLFTHDYDGSLVDLPAGSQAVVDAHVAMRDKTDAELAQEFNDALTPPPRKQEIRDQMMGLMPREQVPVV